MANGTTSYCQSRNKLNHVIVARRLTPHLSFRTLHLIRGRYPVELALSVFEVHHTSPLASAAGPRRTTLEDLAVVCASCHRAIHATSQVEENMREIKEALM